jgi:hypothetical protein
MGALRDLRGCRFGRVVVKERAPSQERKDKKSTRVRWFCQCDCGSPVFPATPYALMNGNTKSCGCLQREAAARNGHARARKTTVPNTLYSQYKYNSKQRGLEFLLTKEEFLLLVSQNCFYCGGKPATRRPHPVYPFIYNGIDRKNNLKGYTKENSAPCCGRCNFMKVKLSSEDFIKQCKKVAAHHSNET